MRDGDDTEFVQFVDGHARELRRTAYLMCGDWQRAVLNAHVASMTEHPVDVTSVPPAFLACA